MTTKLEAIRATREFLHRAPVRRLRENRTRDWGDCVDVEQSDFDLLLAVAEAAAAYLVADKAWKDVRDDDDIDEDEVNDLWRAETDAYIALEAAIEPLMEEVRECH